MVRVRRVVPILLLTLALPAFSAEKKAPAAKPATSKKARTASTASTRPPRNLHKVGDHWTPYNPPDPSTYPPSSKTYKIVRGDTLWALGAKFYGNAYLWPQLWESNTWVTDAHWIYPGDTLLVAGETGAATASTGTGGTTTVHPEVTPQAGTPEGTAMTAQAGPVLGPPVPLGGEADIFCYGYIGDPDEPMPNSVASFEDVETKYLPGAKRQDMGAAVPDIIFIDGGTSSGIVAGETYIIVSRGELVTNPHTKAVIGRQYGYQAQVKILCATETRATAIVSQSCQDIRVGDRLKPLPSVPIPLVRIAALPTVCDPPSGRTTGFIVKAKDYEYILGEGSLVEVNLGKDEMVQPGDFLTVFRDSTVPGAPRQLLGEIGVLTAENHTATAKIVRMRYSMEVGDRVELK
jgi:LysM repeat protein